VDAAALDEFPVGDAPLAGSAIGDP